MWHFIDATHATLECDNCNCDKWKNYKCDKTMYNNTNPRGFDSNNGINQGWSSWGIQLPKIDIHIVWWEEIIHIGCGEEEANE